MWCSPGEVCQFILDIGNKLDLSQRARMQIEQEQQAVIDLLFVMNRYYKFLIKLLSLFALFDRTSCGLGYLFYCQKEEREARLHSSDLIMASEDTPGLQLWLCSWHCSPLQSQPYRNRTGRAYQQHRLKCQE